MKITNIRVYDLIGGERSELAIYEIHRNGMDPGMVSPYRQRLTEIETDAGVSGIAIGGSPDVIALGQQLIGEDPRGYEAIWHRFTSRPHSVDGRSRPLSTLDVALWDLLAKARYESVCRMLGGPVQPSIRAYALESVCS